MFFLYILIAVVILLVMVLIHEFGHYAAAKALGFRINEFSVGFGPALLQRRRKCGELFSLRAVPPRRMRRPMRRTLGRTSPRHRTPGRAARRWR